MLNSEEKFFLPIYRVLPIIFVASDNHRNFANEICENRLHLSNSIELDCIRFALSFADDKRNVESEVCEVS